MRSLDNSEGVCPFYSKISTSRCPTGSLVETLICDSILGGIFTLSKNCFHCYETSGIKSEDLHRLLGSILTKVLTALGSLDISTKIHIPVMIP